jgi:hypothetical protein
MITTAEVDFLRDPAGQAADLVRLFYRLPQCWRRSGKLSLRVNDRESCFVARLSQLAQCLDETFGGDCAEVDRKQ